MPTESINADILLLVVGALPILLAVVYFDRYLSRRRRLASNAEYVAWMQSARVNSSLHQFGCSSQVNRWSDDTRLDLRSDPYIELSTPGCFSRRQFISDRFGRVVAAHYEAYVLLDGFQGISVSGIPMPGRPLLMLASGKA